MKKVFLICITLSSSLCAMEQTILPEPDITIDEVPVNDWNNNPSIYTNLRVNQRQEASLYYYNSPSVLQNFHPSIWGEYKDKLNKVILMKDLEGKFILPNRTNPMIALNCKIILLERICKKLFQKDLKERIVYFPSYGTDTAILERCGFKKIDGMIFFALDKEKRVEVIEENSHE